MIDLNFLKRTMHIRAENSRDNTLLQAYVRAAIKSTEDYCEHYINRDRIVVEFPSFACLAQPLQGYLRSIESIAYVDTNGVSRTLSPTVYGLKSGRYPKVFLQYDQKFPDVANVSNAVVMTAQVGYEASELPENLLIALCCMTGDLYNNRESVAPIQLYEVPMNYQHLVGPFKKGVA